MTNQAYRTLETFMHTCMKDSAHDEEHVYRVLFAAMDIAAHEQGVDTDLLIAACLLHDIGRREQFANPSLDHAQVGAEKARAFLLNSGYDSCFAGRVSEAIRSHRYRSDAPPATLEAKILFDADKLDATGAVGVARTLFYCAIDADPIYTRRPDGGISDGDGDEEESFFQEYHYKLKKLYDRFYTARASQIASSRRQAAAAYYESLLREVRDTEARGKALLSETLT